MISQLSHGRRKEWQKKFFELRNILRLQKPFSKKVAVRIVIFFAFQILGDWRKRAFFPGDLQLSNCDLYVKSSKLTLFDIKLLLKEDNILYILNEWNWMNSTSDQGINCIFVQSLVHIQLSKSGNIYVFVISSRKGFISQSLKVVSPLGERLIILVPWDLQYKKITILKPQNSSSTHSELVNDIKHVVEE